jgi:predicted dinucleotide-binding enzyme
MTTISIIGSGNMATAIGTRAAKHGHTIEVMSRDTAKAQALADKIGNGATAMCPCARGREPRDARTGTDGARRPLRFHATARLFHPLTPMGSS